MSKSTLFNTISTSVARIAKINAKKYLLLIPKIFRFLSEGKTFTDMTPITKKVKIISIFTPTVI